MRQSIGPEFIRFFKPFLEVMKSMGVSGTASEVVDRPIELAMVTEEEQQAVNKNGLSRIKNHAHWARQYLVGTGHMGSSKWGVWNLTDAGSSVNLSIFDPLDTFKAIRIQRFENRKSKETEVPQVDETTPGEEESKDCRTSLLEQIKSLPPSGFERLTQRLLHELGLLPQRTFDVDEKFFEEFKK